MYEPAQSAPAPKVQNVPREPVLSSTGTGFFVTADGYMLTNAHVVDGCAALVGRTVSGKPILLEMVAQDTVADLALLKAEGTWSAASFRLGSVPLGETITVFGFPLAGTLSISGNLTTGSVSALAGLNNDSSRFQISAPVQSGNSGGPVLDESGSVVGVVVSKLNVLRAAAAVGDMPQNVNFAVKHSVAQDFLDSRGVRYQQRQSMAARKVREIASDAQRYTALLACFK